MKITFSLVLTFLLFSSAIAGVYKKDGSYSFQSEDILSDYLVSNFSMLRKYNSKIKSSGIFGIGWKTRYEKSLTFNDNGSISVIDFNDQMRQHFFSNDKASHQIGNVYFSQLCAIQKIIMTKNGYTRIIDNDSKEYYNNKGQLIRLTQKDKEDKTLLYSEDLLVAIQNKNKFLLSFERNTAGQIAHIFYGQKENKIPVSSYKYDGNYLVSVFDADYEIESYQYKKNKLVKIIHKSKDITRIEYDLKNKKVIRLLPAGGDKIEYNYTVDENTPLMSYQTVVKKFKKDKLILTNRHEYEMNYTEEGQLYHYATQVTNHGIITKNIYDEHFNLIEIRKANRITQFEYDSERRLIKKISPYSGITIIEYNAEHNKISKVINDAGWSVYEYTGAGNISLIKDSKGRHIRLYYNDSNEISHMVEYDNDKTIKIELAFLYNEMKKPIKISVQDVGFIRISYDKNGEIDEVDSDGGSQIAIKITSAFQTMLSMVNKAKINYRL